MNDTDKFIIKKATMQSKTLFGNPTPKPAIIWRTETFPDNDDWRCVIMFHLMTGTEYEYEIEQTETGYQIVGRKPL